MMNISFPTRAIIFILVMLLCGRDALGSQRETELLPHDLSSGDWFGTSVAIHGDIAVVGALDNHSGLTTAGSAYVFQRTGQVWHEVTKLVSDTPTAIDEFGRSVAIEDSTIVVGAWLDDYQRVNTGAIHIFDKTVDRWGKTAVLRGSLTDTFDDFGFSVDIHDGAIIAGSHHEEIGPVSIGDSGVAYIFEKQDDVWKETARLIPSDPQGRAEFGISVAIGDDIALVGAHQAGIGGAAYIFKKNGDSWQQIQKLVPDNIDANDRFGIAVKLDGDRAIIGAECRNVGQLCGGSAYIYEREGDNWVQRAELIPNDPAVRFGATVALDGNRAVIGAPFDDAIGVSSGSVFVFERRGESWRQVAKLVGSDTVDGDRIGNSVALDGNTVLAGAWTHDHGLFTQSGAAYVFTIPEPYPMELVAISLFVLTLSRQAKL